mmetsp:Transcript_65126/g.167660  ORF Transcript_65126/g.167660 Transcript_65126/m.167660 type:complete len:764 (+) Transcript_65126:30-2321(+)
MERQGSMDTRQSATSQWSLLPVVEGADRHEGRGRALRLGSRPQQLLSRFLPQARGVTVGGIVAMAILAFVATSQRSSARSSRTADGARGGSSVSMAAVVLEDNEDKSASMSREVRSGDTIFLQAHTHRYIDVTGTEVQARYNEHLDWQALTIELDDDKGVVSSGDSVYLRSQHTGKFLNVEDTEVQAMHTARSNGQMFAILGHEEGPIRSGDTIYLRSAATGMNIDIEGTLAKARYNQKGGWQALRIVKKAFLNFCSEHGENCESTKCCKDEGMTCFKKNQWWSQCRYECNPGPDPTDAAGPDHWECKALGNMTPGDAPKCSAPGEDCRHTKCCHVAGTQCYEKNDGYAACLNECTPGPNLKDMSPDPWTCKEMGKRTTPVAAWVEKTCAATGQACSQQQCCAVAGDQCYRKDANYAGCKPTCEPGIKLNKWDTPWSCEEIGTRTPPYQKQEDSHTGQVSPWVAANCSDEGESCMKTRCCRGVGMQCYAKNKDWATCRASCSTEPDPNDNNATWDCEARGPRSWGLATAGYPSVYCFSVMRLEGYEPSLMKAQMNQSAGIFSCDGFDILADGVQTLGVPKGKTAEVTTLEIPKISVGVSQDGTAANAKLFMAAWDKIIQVGRYKNYDWTVKVDPDAVLLAWRLRDHMRPATGQNVYVVNCNKFPGSPNFPMMYGALEIFSLPAMAAYAQGSWKCGQQLPWHAWGEDFYMTHCMDFLGVGRIGDFGVLGDNMCTGANCGNAWTAAFHPFKSESGWMQCWGQATR